MSPPSDSNAQREPSGNLGERIKSTFGSFADFKKQFTDTGTGLFGSGKLALHVERLYVAHFTAD